MVDCFNVRNTKLSEKSIVATYDIPDRDGVSTKPDYISTGFHNITQYSNGQYIYSIQAFVYPTSLTDSIMEIFQLNICILNRMYIATVMI